VNSALLLLWLLREASTAPSFHRGRRFRRPEERFPVPRVREAPTKVPSADSISNHNGSALLSIRCFGGFEVSRSGQVVQDWRRSKARTLLKILVDRRHPVPREIMIDLLWPEAEARAAGNNLRVTLHALRHALTSPTSPTRTLGESVLIEGGNLQINPDIRIWIDVDEFSGRFQLGCQREREGRFDDAIDEFERAEALYRDDYLVEDLYEDWTQARREELKDQYLLIVTKLADHCLVHGDLLGCILRCHKILQRDACREDAYQRLMYAYAQLGRPSQALHWYEVCLRTLRRELDLGPSEQTVRLHGRILTRELDVATVPGVSGSPITPSGSGLR